MTISEFTLKSSDLEPVRRFEVFTGSGRRREWSPEDKARIVAESYATDETVCAVARRYALSPQQLFAWRRAARQPAAERTAVPESLFVPAVVAAPIPDPAAKRSPIRKRKAARAAGVIELEIDGVAMRVGRGADSKTVAAVIRALKATT
ncbi:IS66-like element accessory protein TnpA [Manganibacter manganicus]|uniref:Insertion sequence protein n=1 Tax=Manganibacter manganicus TaxID=1873176 RepID=A0A1V8RU54_9HYPH|nr:transposase [Pseudaminobacter manganicus]OQM76736.1 insertion sequence protein [Pseudaminobacter manganicus]